MYAIKEYMEGKFNGATFIDSLKIANCLGNLVDDPFKADVVRLEYSPDGQLIEVHLESFPKKEEVWMFSVKEYRYDRFVGATNFEDAKSSVEFAKKVPIYPGAVVYAVQIDFNNNGDLFENVIWRSV